MYCLPAVSPEIVCAKPSLDPFWPPKLIILSKDSPLGEGTGLVSHFVQPPMGAFEGLFTSGLDAVIAQPSGTVPFVLPSQLIVGLPFIEPFTNIFCPKAASVVMKKNGNIISPLIVFRFCISLFWNNPVFFNKAVPGRLLVFFIMSVEVLFRSKDSFLSFWSH